ncbi:FIST N-terminal domain-containing protein, partial [Zoogloea sp.]|uniref:FIST N-terminal domain-containing protein n=1 Tax=Zoogloea sp. TaxID=49181 RepID=UPI0032206201
MSAQLAEDGSATSGIRIGASRNPDPQEASRELAAALTPVADGLSIVFASSRYAPDALAASLDAAFGPTPLVGCTTAGEIGPDGYQEGSLIGACFAPGEIDFEIGLLEDLTNT